MDVRAQNTLDDALGTEQSAGFIVYSKHRMGKDALDLPCQDLCSELWLLLE